MNTEVSQEIAAIEEAARAYQREGNTRAAASLRAKAKRMAEEYAAIDAARERLNKAGMGAA